MKKSSKDGSKIETRTVEQIENRKITKAEREHLKRLARVKDDEIDTTDIPQVKDPTGWVRVHEHPEHPLHRLLSRLVSIRGCKTFCVNHVLL